MIDYTKLREKLDPSLQVSGDPGVRLRVGTVTAVNADGTVDILLSGVTVPDVPRLDGAPVLVGAPVQILSYRGSLLILGHSAVAASSAGSGVWSGITSTSDSSSIDSNETVISTVASATYYAGRAYQAVVLGHVQVTSGPNRSALRIHKTNAAGLELASSETDCRQASTDYEAGFLAVFRVLTTDVTAVIVLTLQALGAFNTTHRAKHTRGLIIEDVGSADHAAFSGTLQLT